MRDGERYGGILNGLKAGMLFVGSIIGAGFASGKEIMTFFAGNLYTMLFTVILAGTLFYLTAMLLFNLGRRISAGNLFGLTEIIFKKYGHVFNFFITFCYLILLAAMLAGVDALAKESLTYSGKIPVFSIGMLVISIIVVRKGIKGLLNVNSVLVPTVVLFLLFVCIFTLSKGSSGFYSVEGQPGFVVSVYQCLLYVSMNMLLSSAIMISAGRTMDKVQIKAACITGAVIITVMLCLILLSCRLNYSLIHGTEMPMISLALKISPIFRVISFIIISCAILTTLISSMYPLKEFFDKYVSQEKLTYFLLAITGFLLSRVGFTYIVTYMYPLQGIIGLLFFTYCINYYYNFDRKKRAQSALRKFTIMRKKKEKAQALQQKKAKPKTG